MVSFGLRMNKKKHDPVTQSSGWNLSILHYKIIFCFNMFLQKHDFLSARR